jgi:hypothetical protein
MSPSLAGKDICSKLVFVKVDAVERECGSDIEWSASTRVWDAWEGGPNEEKLGFSICCDISANCFFN